MEAPNYRVWSEGFPSNYNCIDSGRISRDYCGQPTGSPEGSMVQISVEQALKEAREEGRMVSAV